MTYNDLRKGRVSRLEHVYLITAVTAERRPVFEDLFIGRCVVDAMRAQDAARNTVTLAYVVMPDHIHWLFCLATTESLAAILKRVKGTTARRINSLISSTGAVWQPSFHDHAVRCDESLVTLARYVVMNPVRAGLVDRIGDYPLWDVAWDMSEFI
jgi:REP element-mobilizing transposase RayT